MQYFSCIAIFVWRDLIGRVSQVSWVTALAVAECHVTHEQLYPSNPFDTGGVFFSCVAVAHPLGPCGNLLVTMMRNNGDESDNTSFVNGSAGL